MGIFYFYKMKEALDKTIRFLTTRGFGTPEIGIVLGTGLGKIVDQITIESEVSYNLIPYFPTATVEFHQGKFLFGTLSGKKVVVMQGRFHYYEGYSMQDVTFPIRIMKELGIKILLISNAAGAINLNFKKGELMLITDHINLQGDSPLAFKGVSKYGERFVDMSAPYDESLNKELRKIAQEKQITLNEGVYVSVVGPQLETKAEYRMLKILGADAVGMSTVPEVIVANHLKVPVAAISVITDECDPDNLKPVSIQEIFSMADKAEPDLVALIKELTEKL